MKQSGLHDTARKNNVGRERIQSSEKRWKGRLSKKTNNLVGGRAY